MADRVDVVGNGSVAVRPDVLQAALAAEANGRDVSTALSTAQEAVAAMTSAARGAGVADADLRTAEMSVQSAYDNEGRPSGFRAWLGLSVTMRDLDEADGCLTTVLAAGGNAARVQSVGLAVSDPSAATASAREAAFADARQQAEALAALAGRSLGAVTRVTCAPAYGVVPRLGGVEMADAKLAAMPVEAGTSTVTSTVSVRFALL